MLTLACVIKTRTNPQLPANAVELLRQVVETLSYRWDEAKGVARASETKLSANNMLECAMLIAHEMTGLKVWVQEVLDLAKRYLIIVRREDVPPAKLIDEIRKFFGFLSTTADGQCQFVHKVIHDYFWSRYEVENGLYQPANVRVWDIRAAYCACLTHDATRSLSYALLFSPSVEAVRECLVNSARFDPTSVAAKVFEHFDKYKDFNYGSVNSYWAASNSDFFDVADQPFIDALLHKAPAVKRSTAVDAVLCFCLSECMRRQAPVPARAVPFIQSVFALAEAELIVERFGSRHRFRLEDVLKIQAPIRLTQSPQGLKAEN